MKSKYLMYAFLFILLPIFLSFCSDDDPVSSQATIYGSWVRLITDSEGIQFNAEFKINSNNTYEFILLDEDTPGHTNSAAVFTISGNEMTIIEDADCVDIIGIYEFLVADTQLAFIGVEDECLPRLAALQGIWEKK
jgi:hypothetical protein